MLVNISSTNELLRSVPHGQSSCWVVEKYAIIPRPYNTPDINWLTQKVRDLKGNKNGYIYIHFVKFAALVY